MIVERIVKLTIKFGYEGEGTIWEVLCVYDSDKHQTVVKEVVDGLNPSEIYGRLEGEDNDRMLDGLGDLLFGLDGGGVAYEVFDMERFET